MKKRFLAWLLTLAVLFTLIPAAAMAADSAVASGTCGETLSWVLDDSGTLTISGSGRMDEFLVEGAPAAPWYDYRDAIRRVILAGGITNIGSFAFQACSSMESITIPESVMDLGNETFCNCSSLKSITVPKGVTVLPDGVFEGCSGLEAVSIPDSVMCIQAMAFRDCSSLETVILPESVTGIYSYAFSGCSSLQCITIPDGNRYIDTYAFAGCTSLQTVTMPASVDIVDVGAFQSCGSLQTVYFDGTKEQLSGVEIGRKNDGLQHAAVYVHPSADAQEYVPACCCNDVSDITRYYFVPVLWASEKGITSGYSDGTFRPSQTCTRAQAVVFLYRAAGEPAVSGSQPFGDVQESSYYYDAVRWAVEQGITCGTTETTFSPDAAVTRAQFITFLCRYAGAQDQTCRKSVFEDVSPSRYYAGAVYWGYEAGIVSGTTENLFSPDAPCTRAQAVTFLWRYLGR